MNEQAYTSPWEATVVTASTKKGEPAVIKVWSIWQLNERSSVVADTTVSSSNSSFDDSWLVRFLVGGGVVTFYVVILVIMFMMLMNQHSTEGTKQDGWFLSIRNAKNLFRVRCSFIWRRVSLICVSCYRSRSPSSKKQRLSGNQRSPTPKPLHGWSMQVLLLVKVREMRTGQV